MSIKLILKSLWIGATMTIPGVSGGTMAVVTGIYEDLIKSVNGILKESKKHLPFLLQFVLGADAGFLILARFITYLLENNNTGVYVRFLFAGIVIGGIPLLVCKSGAKKASSSNILFVIFGALLVLLLSAIPHGIFSSGKGLIFVLLQLLGGIIVAIALVLPGISVSHMLYILGLYGPVLEQVYSFKWLSLIPLVAGVLAGTFITAGILERLLNKFPEKVYMTITGFVAASLVSLLPENPSDITILCIPVFIIGFAAMYALSHYSK